MTSTTPRPHRRRSRTSLGHVHRAILLSAILSGAVSCKSDPSPAGDALPTSVEVAQDRSENRGGETVRSLEAGREIALEPVPERFHRIAILPRAPRTGDILTVEADPDDPVQTGFLTYRWFVNGEEALGEVRNTFEGSFKRGDKISVAVQSPDGSNSNPSWTASVRIGNAPPQVEEIESPRLEDGKYRTRLVVSDPDGDILSYSIAKGPEGLDIDDRGTITWVPDQENLGRHEVVVSVRDGEGGEIVYTYSLSIDRR
jgi:hypothetical protein